LGADLYVPSQYATIQIGINAATTGDTVWVADGTYAGTGNKDLSWIGKHITVRSENGPNNCIIDCQNSGKGFTFDSTGQNSSDIIRGFTIMKGNVGGSIDNSGGIYCNSSSPTITNCVITGNSAVYGGGINCYYSSSPTITNCTISNNNTIDWGGGINCYYSSSPTITNCVITGNSAVYGGGICSYFNSSPAITNCIILNNSAASSGGGISCHYAGASINYNNVWNNNPNNYNGISDQAGINGNISDDPEFVSGGDYHLGFSSPCINAGLNSAVPVWLTADLDGNLRIVNGTVDMGAYEFHQPSISICPSSGQVGSIVTVKGIIFTTNTQISISFGTHLTITTTISSTNGTFSCTFIVPTQSPSTKTITAQDSEGNLATTTFYLLPPTFLKILPAYNLIAKNQEFDVNVMIEDVRNLKGAEVHLSF
jgi:hypothetical protein